MNTQTTFADKFYNVMNETVSHYRGEIARLEETGKQVTYAIERVVYLACQLYEEGDDKYGFDYLSQHFSHEQKMMLQEIMDNNLPFDLMCVELDKIFAALKTMERDLRDELKFKNVGPY